MQKIGRTTSRRNYSKKYELFWLVYIVKSYDFRIAGIMQSSYCIKAIFKEKFMKLRSYWHLFSK